MPRRASQGLDFAVYGLFDIDCGLRVAADNTVRAMRAKRETVRSYSVGRDGRTDPDPGGADHDVNLFHLNPDWLERMLRRVPLRRVDPARRLNAMAVFFELPAMPPAWADALESMDVLLAPTAFIADAIRASHPEARVIPLPQAVFLPEGVRADRERFGIPRDVVAFVMSFAVESGIERKNPWDTVDAFSRAFPEDPDVRLVIRVHAAMGGQREALLSGIRERTRDDRRVLYVTEDLDYAGILSLYASCDAYLSLHRSEGLGLGPMEAMSLGKVVVATGWSGNMDFMTADNSLPVAYRLVPVRVPEDSPYRGLVAEGVTWAQPDVDDAVELLRRVRSDADLRERLGSRAAADMEARRARALDAGYVSELERAHAEMAEAPASHGARVARFAAFARRERLRGLWSGAKAVVTGRDRGRA